MSIKEKDVIWINDKQGVVLEEYRDKYSLKVVQKYKNRDQEEVVSYDWTFKQVWNPDTKKREMPVKANCAQGVYLGDREQAIEALVKMLEVLGYWVEEDGSADKPSTYDEDIPF